MATRSGAGTSGIGMQSGDPRPGGSTAGAERPDSKVGTRQAIEGKEEDDLSAASEEGAFLTGARSTPPMGDVRSDAIPGAHDSGEPR